MRGHRFLLSSEDCELLLELENSQTIEKTARALGKDPSGVSRQLSKIEKKYPAIEKRAGKWVLTELGKRLNSVSRNVILTQRQLAEEQAVLRLGTNREFAARVLGPQLMELKKNFENTLLVIQTFEYGTEHPLLSGQIDIGIDCERPNDPEIAYRLLVDEPIWAVCSKAFENLHKKEIAAQKLDAIPHLLCERLYPDKIFMQKDNKQNVAAHFNDIATARAACVAGMGWALLPHYAVQEEIELKKLVKIGDGGAGKAKYGVWWSRARYGNEQAVLKVCDWLKKQKL